MIDNLMSLLVKEQSELHNFVALEVLSRDLNFISDDDAVFVFGEIPITVVAHMDVARSVPWRVSEIGGVIFQNCGVGFCLGGDDRCGVYIMLYHLLDMSPRPNLLFTTDEEIGMVGVTNFLRGIDKTYPEVNEALKNTHFFLQLDRRGKDDCVFYCSEPEPFVKFIESFGWREQSGSFSDISVLCFEYDICGTNVSVGYFEEHGEEEVIVFPYLESTIENVKTLIREHEKSPMQWKLPEYVKSSYPYVGTTSSHYHNKSSSLGAMYEDWDSRFCLICGSSLLTQQEEQSGMCDNCVDNHLIQSPSARSILDGTKCIICQETYYDENYMKGNKCINCIKLYKLDTYEDD